MHSTQTAPLTSAEIERAVRAAFDELDLQQLALIARLPPERRLQIMSELSDFVRGLIVASERARHPELDEAEPAIRVGERLRIKDGRKSISLYSPEDVIIYKLKYYLEGRIEKHLRDIMAILVVQEDTLGYAYIAQWANEIGAREI